MHSNRLAEFFKTASRPTAEPQTREPQATCEGCSCPACQKRGDLRAAKKTAAMITRVIENVASVDAWRTKRETVVARVFIHASPETVPGDSNLVQHTVNELRRMAMEMIAAADRLEWSQT